MCMNKINLHTKISWVGPVGPHLKKLSSLVITLVNSGSAAHFLGLLNVGPNMHEVIFDQAGPVLTPFLKLCNHMAEIFYESAPLRPGICFGGIDPDRCTNDTSDKVGLRGGNLNQIAS
jgi:hypothetical protein